MLNILVTKFVRVISIGPEGNATKPSKAGQPSRDSLQWTIVLVIREVDLSGEAAAAVRRGSISSQLAHGYVRRPIRTMCSHWQVRTHMVSDRSGGDAGVELPPPCSVWNRRGTAHICIRKHCHLEL